MDRQTDTIATVPAGVETEGASWRVQGIDVSKWQGGDFDFARAKSEGGFSFAFIRATVGTSQDPEFARNWHECARADLIRGAYHYAKPSTRASDTLYWVRVDATEEAQAFVKAVRAAEKSVTGAPPLSRGCLMPVLDWEDTENPLSPVMAEQWIKTWIRHVERELGRGVMIYTGDRVWKQTIGDLPTLHYLTKLRLWVPRYTGVAADPGCGPFPRWTFWQWSGGGDADFYERRYGHVPPGPKDPDTHTDVNAFAGTMEELERMTTGELDVFLTPRPEPTPEPLPPEPDPDKFQDLATLTRSLSDHLALVADDLDAIGDALTGKDTNDE